MIIVYKISHDEKRFWKVEHIKMNSSNYQYMESILVNILLTDQHSVKKNDKLNKVILIYKIWFHNNLQENRNQKG